MDRYLYTCCGDDASGYSGGTGCDHSGGRVVSERRWIQLSHGAVGPWRYGWEDRGALCSTDCDCHDIADIYRPEGARDICDGAGEVL